jgi:predicted dehydrogenase
MSGPRTEASPARLVLVGVRGYGQVHAARIAQLAERGMVQLVATVDPGVTADPPLAHGVPLHADLEQALAAVGPVDVVVIAAPIGEHAALAETALRSGADVLLEKPPVASLEDFGRLLETERETGGVVQVGFQSLGSQALPMFARNAFGIGPVARVGAVGAWSRTLGYWSRSPWAGRRRLDGQPVVDGVVTNPLAHAVATGLALVGARTLDDVASVETDLYRANAIESDDTFGVRIRTSGGEEVTCALSLCARVEREPVLHVEGSHGRARYAYTADRVEVEGENGNRSQVLEREDLLENLLAHRRDGRPLLVPLASTGAFMRVLGAVAEADEPTPIDPGAVRWEGEGEGRRPVVDDVEHWLERAAATGQTFRELGVPWSRPERERVAG